MPRFPALAAALSIFSAAACSAGGGQVLGQYDITRIKQIVPEADLSALTASQQARLHLLVSEDTFAPNPANRERIRAILRRP